MSNFESMGDLVRTPRGEGSVNLASAGSSEYDELGRVVGGRGRGRGRMRQERPVSQNNSTVTEDKDEKGQMSMSDIYSAIDALPGPPSTITCPIHPELHEITLNDRGARQLLLCETKFIQRRMAQFKDVDAMVCKFNADHVHVPEVLPLHESYFCSDRNKPRLLMRGHESGRMTTEEKKRLDDKLMFGILHGGSIPAKGVPFVHTAKRKTREELSEEAYWNRTRKGKGFDWLESVNNPRTLYPTYYPPSLTTKAQRKAWELENAKKIKAYEAELKRQKEEKARKKKEREEREKDEEPELKSMDDYKSFVEYRASVKKFMK